MPCYDVLGNLADGRPFWDAKFSQSSRADLVFYYPGDGRWWLGALGGTQLTWNSPGSTSGLGPNDPDFGQVWDGRPFWAGDFDGDGKAEILFYYPGDGNWWLGTFVGSPPSLSWNLAGNTNNFGQVADGRPFWVADFNGDGKAEILFHFPGDGNWWLGTFGGSPVTLSWGNTPVGNTNNFGQVWDGRPFWAADFRGGKRADILFYHPGDGNWWLGTFAGSPLTLSFGSSPVSNTNNFGQVWDGRPFWANDFNGDGRYEILFYYPGDGNWWLGTFLTPRSRTISWSLVSSTGRPYDQRLRFHVKIVNNNSPPLAPIATMVSNMQLLFAQASILVDWVSTENLTIPFLSDIAVPSCVTGGDISDEHDQLFENRNNAEPNDVVVYFVRSIVPALNGCALHPYGSPGAIVTATGSQWTLAHEVGHVLGLEHIAGENAPACTTPNFARLMTGCGTNNTVGTPTLIASELDTMQESVYVKEC